MDRVTTDEDRDGAEEFHLGPAWVGDADCCGKPVGCTNVGDGCLLRNHPWKRRNVRSPGDVPTA
jgi:hypothetical protein